MVVQKLKSKTEPYLWQVQNDRQKQQCEQLVADTKVAVMRTHKLIKESKRLIGTGVISQLEN